MADQNQIREARRRRILENSESRLQRILGVTNAETGADSAGKHVQTEQLQDARPTLVPTPTVKKTDAAHNEESIQLRSRTAQKTEPTTTDELPTVSASGPLPFTLPNMNEDQANPSSHGLMVLLVMLAVTSVAMLSTGFGIFIGNNALLPFVIYEGYSLLFSQKLRKPPSSLVNTALLLSGLPQDRLSQLTRITQNLHTCFQDLCVYLFVCLVSHEVFKMFT